MPGLDCSDFQGSRMSELIYCSYEGRPTIYVKDSGGVAWWFYDGSWKAAPGPEVFVSAAVIGKDKFIKWFSHLPPLPDTT